VSRDLIDRLAWDAPGLPRRLQAVAGRSFSDPAALIRLHERLLFIRAYPASAEVLRLADALLFSFAGRIAELRAAGGNLEAFEDPKISGIAGTSFSAVFSYEVARRLCARHPRHLEIDWENYDGEERLGPLLRRFLPLLDEDWPVEAHVPFRAWMEAGRGAGGRDLPWLLGRIAALPLTPRQQAELYESLDLLLIWHIGNVSTSRSRLRLPVRRPYYHGEPLLRRSDISLAQELESPPLPVERLAPRRARQILDIILDTSAMRYRELYGFTHPDARHVYRAQAGRGVEIYVFGVPAEWRLPLRAYHGGLFFKNGVPAGYVEVLSLFERAEVGFNLYYTFREGESAWLYARLLRLFRQLLGVSCFSVDPYQAGWQNEEALESGAFWFYRKLGFRPLDAEAARLAGREERRMAQAPGYRSSRRTLEKMARAYLLYECGAQTGDWDRFRVRNLLLRCTRSQRDEIRDPLRQVLRMIPDLERWPARERAAADAIVRAKQGPEEWHYLRLMQRHARLRAAILELGS
jgi:hypothetical protein